MSEKKKKRKKTIHVDELVVKADKVVFVDKDGKEKSNERQPYQESPEPFVRDPWGFLFPRRVEEASAETSEDKKKQEKVPVSEQAEDKKNEGNEEQFRGWRWI